MNDKVFHKINNRYKLSNKHIEEIIKLYNSISNNGIIKIDSYPWLQIYIITDIYNIRYHFYYIDNNLCYSVWNN